MENKMRLRRRRRRRLRHYYRRSCFACCPFGSLLALLGVLSCSGWCCNPCLLACERERDRIKPDFQLSYYANERETEIER